MANYPDWFLKGPHRPPEAAAGEPSDEQLYYLVGRICHQWEMLEGTLLDLYLRLMERAHIGGPINLGAYSAVFGSIASSEARRGVVQSLGEAIFMKGTPQQKEIQRLMALVGRAVGRRNEAAHGVVTRFSNDKGVQGFFVMPPPYRPLASPWNSDGEWIEGDGFRYRYNAASLLEVISILLKLDAEFDALFQMLGVERLTTWRDPV